MGLCRTLCQGEICSGLPPAALERCWRIPEPLSWAPWGGFLQQLHGGTRDTHSSPAPPRPCWELGGTWHSLGRLCGKRTWGKAPQETT